MPTTLDIHISNDTTFCTALKKACIPDCSQWNPAPPDILYADDGHEVHDARMAVSVNQGFKSVGLTYEYHTDKGSALLRLEINEGKLDQPIAFTSEPTWVRAKVTAAQLDAGWYYELEWTDGSGD